MSNRPETADRRREEWDGRPLIAPEQSGYHWLRRTNNHGRPVSADTALVIAYWEVNKHGQPSWWAQPFMLGHWQITDVARQWAYVAPVATPASALPRQGEQGASHSDGLGDGRRICEALGFDPTNHHNAEKCPYCNPHGWTLQPVPSLPVPGEAVEIDLAGLDLGEPDLASQIAAAVMSLKWTHGATEHEHWWRYGEVQEAVAPIIAATLTDRDATLTRLQAEVNANHGVNPDTGKPLTWRELAEHRQSSFLAAKRRAEAAEGEVNRLKGVIERDRTRAAEILGEAKAVLGRHPWLAEGRGSYAYDDDRWHDEFAEVMKELNAALDPMRVLAADWSDCPRNSTDVAAARVDRKARAALLQAEVERLTGERDEWRERAGQRNAEADAYSKRAWTAEARDNRLQAEVAELRRELERRGCYAPDGKLWREMAYEEAEKRGAAEANAQAWHRVVQTIATILDLPEPDADSIAGQVRARVEAVEAERNRIKAFLSEGSWETIQSEQAWKRRAVAAEARADRLAEALERIERWFGEFPETGDKWPDGSPVSYGAAYGSNGERDYMRGIARAALAQSPTQETQS